jgi:hypothetical protein
MAENPICHPLSHPVIKKFLESIDKAISSSSIILSSNIQKHFIPDGKSVYLKGNVMFVDSSILEIAMFVSETRNGIAVDKYRLHYMKRSGQMLFRYDNAHHHPEITSYPHHKHIPGNVIPSAEPSLKDVLKEISATIIRRP